MTSICSDIGNYSTLIASVDGRTSNPVLMLRSLVYGCTHNQEVREGLHNPENPLICINRKYYKLGRQAGLYHGHLSAAEAGKARPDIALPLLLAGTPQNFKGDVKLLVPRRDPIAERLLTSAIVGVHEYLCNGRASTATFTAATFHEETKTAAKYAFDAGVVAPGDVVLLVDIGGGTFNAVVAAYDDDLFSTRFYKSYPNSGGIALAKAIGNTDTVKAFGKAVDTSKIMDAITQGKRHIGNRQDFDFSGCFDDCVADWFDGMLTRVLSDTEEHLDEVTRILWCGGGAELLKNRLNQAGHVILDNPQFANINALIQSSKTQALTIVA